MLEKRPLMLDDGLRDLVERALALVQTLHQPDRGAHLFLKILLVLVRALLDAACVELVELQPGQSLLVEENHELLAEPVHEHVGADVERLLTAVAGAWHGVELLQNLQIPLEVVHRDLELAADGLVATLLQVLQVVADDAQQHRVIVLQHLQLHQQTLLGRARRHPHRVETLHAIEHALHGLDVGPGHLGYLLHRRLQIARGVQVPNDHFPDPLLLLRKIGQSQLPLQMPVERGLGRQPGLERHVLGNLGLPDLGLLGRRGEVAQVVLPVRVADQIGFAAGFLGVLRPGGDLLGDVVRVLLLIRLLQALLQKWILQQLLLHCLKQLQPGQLQELDSLLQLGRHHQLLRKLELLP